MTAIVGYSPPTILQFFDNRGNPAAGGTVLTQVSGVNYATYQDSGGVTALPNPIPLNSRGEISNSSGVSCQLFLVQGQVYTFTLYDSAGNQLNQATSVEAVSLLLQLGAVGGAGLVGYGYTTSYSAATVGLKLQQSLSVTDSPYSAVADGTTDDTTAVQNALNSGALLVTIPQGKTVAITSVTLAANQTLRIDGVIKKLSGTSPAITMAAGSKVFRGTINGNSQNANGIYAAGVSNFEIDGVYLYNVGIPGTPGNGVSINIGAGCSYYRITNNQVTTGSYHGINLTATTAQHAIISNNRVDTCNGGGIQFWGGDASTNPGTYISDVSITGNQVYNTLSGGGGAGGIWGGCGKNITVSGNTVDTAADICIDFEGCVSCTVSGNTVKDGSNAGIALLYGCYGCNITGNSVLVTGSGVTQWYGIWLAATAGSALLNRNNAITGNSVSASGNYAIYCDLASNGTGTGAGSGTTISGNTILGGVNLNEHDHAIFSSNNVIDGGLALNGSKYCLVAQNRFQRISLTDAIGYATAPVQINYVSATYSGRYNRVTGNYFYNWAYTITDNNSGSTSSNEITNNRSEGIITYQAAGFAGLVSGNVLQSNPNTATTVATY